MTRPPLIDAVLAAGGVPAPGDPLYALTQGRPKALLPIGGRPMAQWVLDALSGVARVRQVIVVGLSPAQAAGLTCARPWQTVPDHGALIDNLAAGARRAGEADPPPTHLLAISSDIPLISPAMIDWSLDAALETDHDAYFTLIPRAVTERRFPGSRRTFFRLAEGEFSAADLNLLKLSVVADYNPAWRLIFQARKSPLRTAGLVGVEALLRFVFGRLTLDWAVRRAKERLGVEGRLLICPHAEAGMDVDKPAQYEVVRRVLETGDRGPGTADGLPSSISRRPAP